MTDQRERYCLFYFILYIKENINYSNEYISRLQGARNKLCKASMQKDTLWKELKANAKEEDVRSKATPAYHH